jgi:hypothetical protein
MRFKEFLFEYGDYDEDKMQKDCAFYFDQIGKDFVKSARLYHGGDDDKLRTLNKFKPRTYPKDTDMKNHNFMNEAFTKEYGHPFRNGLFTSGSRFNAAQYGDLFVIIPVGHFDWLCNLNFEDAYTILTGDIFDVGREVEKVVGDDGWIHNKDLIKCIHSRNEIMLWPSNGFYAFQSDDIPRFLI